MKHVGIEKLDITLNPSQERVLIRPFIPGNAYRRSNIIQRVMTHSEQEVRDQLDKIIAEFTERHYDIKKVLLRHFDMVQCYTTPHAPLSEERRLLIGAYFSQEYSLESAALFNPSIVLHPDQSNLSAGRIRFIMSLRATGEGHISSIVFREGIITDDFQIRLKASTPLVIEPERNPDHTYEKQLFYRKLEELNLDNAFSRQVSTVLREHFTLPELEEQVEHGKRQLPPSAEADHTAEGMLALAHSNYEVTFDKALDTSEKAIFPFSPSHSNGIEDARFVRFQNDDGTHCYYGTYTAFDGTIILPQLIETKDFTSFKFITLNGPAVKNKGMALFPRKINDLYVMLSRQDNENLYIMYSDNIHFWYEHQMIIEPSFPWEFVQLGNCGSPIETDAGWLVLSHGVGPMRKYSIGAFLLDKKDPANVIGRLSKPLIEPDENERKGYVPNVVYTCGALQYKHKLIIPYAMSDYATSFAIADIGDIIGAME